jgi:lysozyme family protein
MSWTAALALLIQCEGGYVSSSPPEGATFAGVLQRYYTAWCQQKGRVSTWPPTQEAVASYYYDAYWTPYQCGALPEPADAVALQCVVNLPWQAAHQALQIALGVYPDGDIGPVTLAAIRNWSADELCERVLVAQIMQYCCANTVGLGNFDGLVVGRIGKVKAFLAAN